MDSSTTSCPGRRWAATLVHGRGDERQVRLAGLLQRRRDADADGVHAGERAEVRRRRERAGRDRRPHVVRRQVGEVGLAASDRGRLRLVGVQTDGFHAGPRDGDGQRQPHVAEADDPDARLFRTGAGR